MLEILESDEVGREITRYISSPGTRNAPERIDVQTVSSGLPLLQRLLAVFLPSGYPHTVTPDYTSYQIYDSLQAFSSSIAGLLASRAVLQGLGVGDENASATAAMLLSVLQESMGRVATILFAHRFSKGIEAECKMYRLAADIFNDIAMVSDCLSPMFPKPFRVPLFCTSSIFRSICGVAGGSSKAILSSHFAKSDNIGELNAKDSSQETIISLLGMWAGGLIVSRVTSPAATWIWLICLLAVHLGTNYVAVRSVSLRSMNRQRVNIVFSHLMSSQHVLTPEEAARQERIFEGGNLLRWRGKIRLGTCNIGLKFRDLLEAMGGASHPSSGSFKADTVPLQQLIELYTDEDYILWFNNTTQRASIVLSKGATHTTSLKAWSHALRVAHTHSRLRTQPRPSDSKDMLLILADTLAEHNQVFSIYLERLKEAGWLTSAALLEVSSGTRVSLFRDRLKSQH